MQFSLEGKTGILLALVGLAGGGAIMIAPDKLWIGWGLITIAALGSVGLGFHHFGRRFSFIFVALGVLWFDYWYYSNVVNAPVVVQASHPVTSPIAAPSPAPSPTPSKPKLVSNIAKMILVCDSPKSAKTPSLKERKVELAKYLDLMEKIFGYAAQGNVAEDELSFSIEVPQPTGGTLKQDYLIKRSGDRLFVSITNHIPQNALAFIFALASLAPIDPNEDSAKQTQMNVEKLVKVEPGKCKFV
ncbi:hypothetical protein [Bradyrhizobium sp.]|uniref:hypothetical protein n=2 Tax=Bradyrhizobium sp. TaxID=376 RepID=UPI003BC4D18C